MCYQKSGAERSHFQGSQAVGRRLPGSPRPLKGENKAGKKEREEWFLSYNQ